MTKCIKRLNPNDEGRSPSSPKRRLSKEAVYHNSSLAFISFEFVSCFVLRISNLLSVRFRNRGTGHPTSTRQLLIQYCVKSAKYFSVSWYTVGIQAFMKKNYGVNFLRAVAQIEFYLLTPPHLVRQIFGFFLKYFYKRTNSN